MSSPLRRKAMEGAIASGNSKKIRLLLKAGVPADGDWQGHRFIRSAALVGNVEAFDILHDAGATPDLPELLYQVVGTREPTLPVVRRLLELEPRTLGELSRAAEYAVDNPEIVSHLVSVGANPPSNSPDPLVMLRKVLAPAVRDTWLPSTVRGEDDPMGSKFAGIPRLADPADWPRCGYCDKPLQLILQLDLRTAPLAESCGQEGFLQVFYCREPDTYCDQAGDDMFSPFGKFLTVRIHEVAPDAPQIDTDLATQPLRPARILRWMKQPDWPSPEQPAATTGVTLTSDEREALEDYWDDCDIDPRKQPLTWPKDKLAGWPVWLQDYDPARCPECGEPMAFLLQIASHVNLPYGWGDSGIAQLTRCASHPEVWGFSWAGS